MSTSEEIQEFESEASEALDFWAANTGHSWELGTILTGGKTDAVVATVLVGSDSTGPEKLVVKVCPPEVGMKREAGRHYEAWKDAPDKFKRHLLNQVHPPFSLPDGRLLMFLEFADGMASLSALRGNLPLLASTCRAVVKGVLDNWNSKVPGNTKPWDTRPVSGFLEKQLGKRLLPGSQLRAWAEPKLAEIGRSLVTGDPLPDPLALPLGTLPESRHPRNLVVGRAHGDLHPGNIFVPVESRRWPLSAPKRRQNTSAFRLIDLYRYDPRAPLARDPVHLLLSIILWNLPDLPDAPRAVLTRFLITSDPQYRGKLPAELDIVIPAILTAGESYAGPPRNFKEEWNEQISLSLVSCALVFAGRGGILDEEDRLWFLRLAAHATEAYLGARSPAVLGAPVRRHPSSPSFATPPEPDHIHNDQATATQRPVADLDGINEEQLGLLRACAAALDNFLALSAKLDQTPSMSLEFAELSAQVENLLSTVRDVLARLEGQITAGIWPDPAWAVKFGAERSRHKLIFKDNEHYGDRYEQLRVVVVDLQQLMKHRYPSLFLSEP